MKRINPDVLKPGDIVLTTSSAAVSKAIRLATRSDISHAMVCVQNHSVIDATDEGVQARNIQRFFFENECSVFILRAKAELSAEQLLNVCRFARSQIGTEYSVREAVSSVVGGVRIRSRKQYCSRLVTQAFNFAGIRLVADVDYSSPEDIRNSPLLALIDNPTVEAEDREIEWWRTRLDIPQLMRDAQNEVLDAARTKSKEIQTFEDMTRYLIEHPEDDAFIDGLLRSSGYLSLWEIERNKNPWQYDLDEMSRLPDQGESLEAYCRDLLAEEAETSRYVINRGAYSELCRLYSHRTFRSFFDLYQTLATLHSQRVGVASAWLKAQGLIEDKELAILRPHTPEWFKALEVWDPLQAGMTRSVIGIMGTSEVCSICGDDPVHDYQLTAGHRPPGGVDTFRLCDDCLEIRKNMGENYTLLPVAGKNG